MKRMASVESVRKPAPSKPRVAFSFGESGVTGDAPIETARRLIVECFLPHWRVLSISLGCMVVSAATAGVLPFVLQRVGDAIFVAKDVRMLYILPLVLVLVTFVRAATSWISTVADTALGAKVISDLRVRMFDTIAAADLAWIQQNHSGKFVSVFGNDVGIVNGAAAKVMSSILKDGLTLVILIGAMFYMDWRLGLTVMIGAPVAVLNLGRQRKKVKRFAGFSLREAGDLNSILTQTLQSIRIVKAYGQEANEAKRLRRTVDRIRKYVMKSTRSRASVGPVWDLMIGIGVAAGIFYGGWQGIEGNVSLGHFMGFMTAAMLAFRPMKTLAGTQISLTEGLLAAQRVFGLIDHASHVIEKPGAAPLQLTAGRITFRDVRFAYNDESGPVLDGFDLDIPAGKKLALVGPSGAGKSTVLNLILRFFDPGSGEVLIDGQDLRDTTIPSVRAASALLTQDAVIFDDTVMANIAYGSEDASEEEVIAAAQAAAAHDFISQLPQGYQTMVGESGNRLSGGERQRIAFARAILRNTPIVLLDEPTSALDAESEAKVQVALERLLAGRTVVMIAHRLSTVKKADRICVMQAGRVVEAGTHSELLARGGIYTRMVHTQFLGDERQLAAAGG